MRTAHLLVVLAVTACGTKKHAPPEAERFLAARARLVAAVDRLAVYLDAGTVASHGASSDDHAKLMAIRDVTVAAAAIPNAPIEGFGDCVGPTLLAAAIYRRLLTAPPRTGTDDLTYAVQTTLYLTGALLDKRGELCQATRELGSQQSKGCLAAASSIGAQTSVAVTMKPCY